MKGTKMIAKRAKVHPIDTGLRKAIRAAKVTHYSLGRQAGVAPSQIDRFMLPQDDPRHRDLRLRTAARIASVLGLELA